MARKPFVPRQLTERQWFFFLAFMGLLTRFPMLGVFRAEPTDSILNLIYFDASFISPKDFYILPGFPALLRLGVLAGMDGILWGRVLAATGGLLFLIPLWRFSRRWVSIEMSGIIGAMAIFSPLLWEWSLRAMGDTLFLALFFWSLERSATVWIEGRSAAWGEALVAGMASAYLRPEGLLLLPWIVAMGEKGDGSPWVKRVLTLALWAAPLYLVSQRAKVLLSAYREGLGLTEGNSRVSIPFLNFIDHFYAYLSQPFYVFTPLVFWFALLGLAKMIRRPGPEGTAFKNTILQVYALLFLSRLSPTTYQDRHMLPFLPVLLVAAGYHLEHFFDSLDSKERPIRHLFLRNSVLTVCLAWSALYACAVLVSENDSFGDIRRSSEFLRTLPSDSRIYSDEVPKTEYWSGRKVRLMPYLEENTAFVPVPGDIVVLHSFYVPRLGAVDRHLTEVHDAQVLNDETSMVVPLLTDVMEEPSLQNRISATAFRFQPQFFRSRVYRVRK